MSARATPAVSLEGVTYRYPGTQAGVFDVTVDIEPGELVVCLGPSGCGKTTLLRLIAGFLKPDAGVIRLEGEDVSALPTRSRECGVVFQAYALFPHMRVWENVAYPLRVREVALDAATRVAMRDEVRRIQRSHHIATLLITHDQDEALSLADRIVLLKDGALVQTGSPQEIYDAPADAFVAGFIGRANLLEARVIDAETVETAIGWLATPAHGRAAGSTLKLLVRPERIEVADGTTGENVFAARVLRDRFFGATRQLEVAAGEGRLEIETAMRDDVAHVRVPREAIQFLNAH